MKSFKPTPLLAGMALAVLALAASVTTTTSRVSRLRAAADAAEAELAALRATAPPSAPAGGSVEQLRRSAATFAHSVPSHADVGAILDSFPAGGPRDGSIPTTAPTVTAGTPAQRDVVTRPSVAGYAVMRLPVSVRLTGTTDQVMPMLRGIETSRNFARLDRVNVQRRLPDPAAPLEFEVDFSMFARTTGSEVFACVE